MKDFYDVCHDCEGTAPDGEVTCYGFGPNLHTCSVCGRQSPGNRMYRVTAKRAREIHLAVLKRIQESEVAK